MILAGNSKPGVPLYGLVLAGGRSTRMGQDKSAMLWHGKEQKYYMADLLAPLCESVFISCRPDQQHSIDPAYQTIVDSVEGAGPLVALLSAFGPYPGVAWFVIACDLPLLGKDTLQALIAARDPHMMATTFRSPHDGLPEPLITIWEPAAAPMLRLHFADGFKCPRKALLRNEDSVLIVEPPSPDALMNTNTPEEAELARARMKNDR